MNTSQEVPADEGASLKDEPPQVRLLLPLLLHRPPQVAEDQERQDLGDFVCDPLRGRQLLREGPEVVLPLVFLEHLAQQLLVIAHLLEGRGEKVQSLLLRGQVEVPFENTFTVFSRCLSELQILRELSRGQITKFAFTAFDSVSLVAVP